MKQLSKYFIVVLTVTTLFSCEAHNSRNSVSALSDSKNTNSTLDSKVKFNEMMEEERFWKVMDTLKTGVSLQDVLNRFSANEILLFSCRFDSLMSMSYDYKLWGAAYVINGGCSDDCFEDFRTSLISQGKQRFYDFLSDPEDCVDWIQSEDFIDVRVQSLVYEVYLEKTGKELPEYSVAHKLKGQKFDENNVHYKFPKLAKRFLQVSNK